MKDWDIIKRDNNFYLVHANCPIIGSGIPISCYWSKYDKLWTCPRCLGLAPKEVALMADLCYCYERANYILQM